MRILAPSEMLEKLKKNVGFKDDGSVEIAKNLEIDGNVLSLNGGEWGIMPIVFVEGSTYTNSGFLLTDRFPLKNDLTQGDLENIGGIWVNADEDTMGICGALESISQTTANTKIENGILYLDGVKASGQDNSDYYNFSALFGDFVTDTDIKIIGSEYFQSKLFNHNLTLTANSKTYNITLQSTNNLKVDSIADLRTILNIKATTDSLITPVCNSDLTSTACLQITTALCKIGADNVTAVSDKVTAL